MSTNRIRNTNRWIEVDGERKLLCDWAELSGVSVECICMRVKRGWTWEEAVLKTPRKYTKPVKDVVVVPPGDAA